MRELGKEGAIDADTVFQLASVSKSLAATVVSSVVGDGAVAWESRMADIAPGFALHDAWPTQNVSLADLFAHRSGLLDHAGDLLEDLGFDRDEVLHRLRYLEPAYSFREGYEYTNFGLTAAAVAVAQVVGTSWEDLSAERLYDPLGMTHTSSRFADYMAEPNRADPARQRRGYLGGDAHAARPGCAVPGGWGQFHARELAQWMRLQLGQGSFEGQQLIPSRGPRPDAPAAGREQRARRTRRRNAPGSMAWASMSATPILAPCNGATPAPSPPARPRRFICSPGPDSACWR